MAAQGGVLYFLKIILAQDHFCSIFFLSVFSKTDIFFRLDEESFRPRLIRMFPGQRR